MHWSACAKSTAGLQLYVKLRRRLVTALRQPRCNRRRCQNCSPPTPFDIPKSVVVERCSQLGGLGLYVNVAPGSSTLGRLAVRNAGFLDCRQPTNQQLLNERIALLSPVDQRLQENAHNFLPIEVRVVYHLLHRTSSGDG